MEGGEAEGRGRGLPWVEAMAGTCALPAYFTGCCLGCDCARMVSALQREYAVCCPEFHTSLRTLVKAARI